MGSVSSLVTGNHSLDVAKPCRASGQSRLKRESGEQRRSGGCSLDDLLKCSFSPGSSYPAKGLSHSRSGRSEDFFYIKVSQKPRPVQHRGSAMEESDSNTDEETTPKLLYRTRTDRASSTEQPLVRAFTPVVPKSTSSAEMGHKSLDRILAPREKTSPDVSQKAENLSGTLSDSGRNSMSSLPTHSTGDSLGPISQRDSGSPAAHSLGKGLLPTFPSWLNGINVSPDSRYSPAFGTPVSKANASPNGSPRTADKSSPLSETAGGIRSPITADDSLIEHLERRLVARESELQRLQVGLEEKGPETGQRFEDRRGHGGEDMEGLKQQSRMQQPPGRSPRALQLQVCKLQEEKQKLEDHVMRLNQEKELMEMRLRAYETHSTLAPTLEETQWEVCQKTGEIFLLKQQLRDSQAEVSHKLNEILSLRALLKDISAKMETFERQSREHEDKLHARAREAEVSQNELQRKKNEADMLREKVCSLESDNEALRRDLSSAKERGPPSPVQTNGTKRYQEEVDTLRQQVLHERDAKDELSASFERERQTWNREKEKVIKYQKQLQINYLQMHKKNRELERTLREVTAELEAKTDLARDAPYCAALQTYEDVIATEI